MSPNGVMVPGRQLTNHIPFDGEPDQLIPHSGQE
jgi:hypothetical protein